MKRLPLLLLLLLFCCTGVRADEKLFHVRRNLNRNIIVYDACLNDGKLNVKDPIHVYWKNLEHNPVTTNELNFIQRKLAYGYSIISCQEGKATIKLKAYKERPLRVYCHEGKWVAVTTINGAECILTEIYAHCLSKTSCEYLELHGKRLAGGQKEVEKVLN